MIVLLLSVRTHERNKDWESEGALFEAAMSVCGDSVKVLQNVGILRRRTQDYTKAMVSLKVLRCVVV